MRRMKALLRALLVLLGLNGPALAADVSGDPVRITSGHLQSGIAGAAGRLRVMAADAKYTDVYWPEGTAANGKFGLPENGTTGQYLKLLNSSTGQTGWATLSTTSPLTTKGDLYTFTTVDARLPVGADGKVLMADSSQTTGLKWETVGGTGTVTGNGSDNDIARWDGTDNIQDSDWRISDSGQLINASLTTPTSNALNVRASGDGINRFEFDASGKFEWSDGSSFMGPDASLERADEDLIALGPGDALVLGATSGEHASTTDGTLAYDSASDRFRQHKGGSWANVGTGDMTSFTLGGDSGSSTISDGDTQAVNGTSAGIDTSVSGDSVTVALDLTELSALNIAEGVIPVGAASSGIGEYRVNSATSRPYFRGDTRNWDLTQGGWDISAVSGSDFTTTSTSLVDITGLTFAAAANTRYEFQVLLQDGTSAVSTGLQFGLNYSAAGASALWTISGTSSAGAGSFATMSAFNTNSGNTYLTANNLQGVLCMQGLLTTGANAGNFTVMVRKVTSGTATIYQGSMLKVRIAGT